MNVYVCHSVWPGLTSFGKLLQTFKRVQNLGELAVWLRVGKVRHTDAWFVQACHIVLTRFDQQWALAPITKRSVVPRQVEEKFDQV
jgi:hypothetical protein